MNNELANRPSNAIKIDDKLNILVKRQEDQEKTIIRLQEDNKRLNEQLIKLSSFVNQIASSEGGYLETESLRALNEKHSGYTTKTVNGKIQREWDQNMMRFDQ